MKMVVAIVRTTSLERIVKALEQAGVRGLTISEIRGVGQHVTLSSAYSIHNRIELFIPDAIVDTVMNVILEQAKSGLPGDGLIVSLPVESLMKIRTCEHIDDGTCENL